MSSFLIPPNVKKWLIRSRWVGGVLLAVVVWVAFLVAVGRLLYLIGQMGH